MLDKLLRRPLPEQIVALLEKLEQNPDTSHLEKVEQLLDYYETQLTRYEEWVIKRQMRKIRNVIRREKTLNHVMRIVINDKTDEEKRQEAEALRYNALKDVYSKQLAASMQNTKNTVSASLLQHAQMHQDQVQLIKAHQAAQQARDDMYARGYTDSRSYFNARNYL